MAKPPRYKVATADREIRHRAVGRGLPRVCDVIISLLALCLCSPLLIVAALGVKVSSRGGAFFRQQRVGLRGHLFTLYKLRTMKAVEGQRGTLITARNDQRITGIGKVLRRTKIDELPQLWNVLNGEMSLVGPRPEVPQLVNLNNELWQLVLQVKPGITDPVSLALRDEEALLASVTEDRDVFYLETLQPLKLKGYINYLQQRNWQRDVLILCQTCLTVFFTAKFSGSTHSDFVATITRVKA